MRVSAAHVLPESVRAELARVGEIVRTARLNRGLSQADVAARLRVSIPTLQAIEKGAPGASAGTLLALVWLLELGSVSHALGERLEARPVRQRVRKRSVADALDV